MQRITRVPPPVLGGLVLVGVTVALVAWYLISPLFINKTVDEMLPAAQSGAASAGKGAGPMAVARGGFTEIDRLHYAMGQAVIYTLGDGQRVLRFEEFQAGNGPDLYVYLSTHPQPRTSEELHNGGEINLGRLKGNIGNQNYEVPAGVEVSQVKSVVIYCKQFAVIFSTAELMAAGA